MLDEKSKYYINRTVEHIHRVQKNMITLLTLFSDELGLDEETCRKIIGTVLLHDSSKFDEEQYEAYKNFTWAKKNNEELSEKDQKVFDEAWEDHYTVECHHPEGEIIWEVDYIEIACDLIAMSQEFGDPSAREYFEDVWKDEQKKNFDDNKSFQRCCNVISKCIYLFDGV